MKTTIKKIGGYTKEIDDRIIELKKDPKLTWKDISKKIEEEFNIYKNTDTLWFRWTKTLNKGLEKSEDISQPLPNCRNVATPEIDSFVKTLADRKEPWDKILKRVNKTFNVNFSKSGLGNRYRKKLRGNQDIPKFSFKTFEEKKKEDKGEEITSITYDNTDSILKHSLRKMLVNTIIESECENKAVLSMPADNFVFEELLASKSEDYKFLCVEKNQETYTKGLMKSLNLGCNYMNVELNSVLPNLQGDFGAIWMDFCGPFTSDVRKSIETVSNKSLLASKGTLAITLLNGRELDIDFLKGYMRSNESNDAQNCRYLGIPRYIKEVFGNKIALDKVVKYQDYAHKETSSPMLLYIFRYNDMPLEYSELLEFKTKKLII